MMSPSCVANRPRPGPARRSLLAESDGIADRYGAPVVWPASEMARQNREFATAVQARGKSVTLLIGEGYNHFELHETLGNPYGLLGRAVLKQMKLG